MRKHLILLFAILLVASPSFAATYYVATGGSNGAAGSLAAPWQTIKYAVAHVSPGDTVNIRTGTYVENIRTYNGDTVVSGTAGNVITVQAYNSEVVTIRPGSGAYQILWIGGVSYTTWKDIIFDATSMSGQEGIGVSNASLHNTFDNVELENTYHFGFAVAHGSHFTTIKNSRIHDWGQTSSNQDHAIYVSSGDTNDTLIEYNTIHDGTGFGVHIYNGDGTKADRTIIRNNRIYRTGFRGGVQNSVTSIAGILVTDSADSLVYNNLVYENLGTGIESAFGSGTTNLQIYNNTVYANGTYDTQPGIYLSGGATSAIIKNNIVYGNGSGISDLGSGTTSSTNTTANPSFVDVIDFVLQAGSVAISAGANLSAVFTTDFLGRTRPAAAFDNGAYDYIRQLMPILASYRRRS